MALVFSWSTLDWEAQAHSRQDMAREAQALSKPARAWEAQTLSWLEMAREAQALSRLATAWEA